MEDLKTLLNGIKLCREKTQSERILEELIAIQEYDDLCERNELLQFIYNHSIVQIKQSKKSSIVFYENLSLVTYNLISYYKDKFDSLSSNSEIAFGLKFSQLAGNRKDSKFNHLMDFEYLYKKLEQIKLIYIECINLHKYKMSYVTDRLLDKTKKKLEKEKLYLENTYLKNQSGEVFSLAQLTRDNDTKLAELHAFNKQLELKAEAMGFTWVFATITCPPKFHINPKQSKSDCWDRESTPKDSVNFINKIWSNFRKKIDKLDIDMPFGFWSKEPHSSAAVHKHALIFCRKEDVSAICRWISHYTKLSFSNVGHKYVHDVSCKFVVEKTSEKLADKGKKKAKPSSYIFKYIKKGLCISDEDSKEFRQIQSHYKEHKYRRFGFFGIDRCIVLWRELKRFNKLELKTDDEALLELSKMVKDNNFKDFCTSPLKDFVEFIYKDAIYDEYGNFIEYYLDDYGDDKKQICGFVCNGVEYKTRNEYIKIN
ncbi:hypothetical protein tloyanaT_21030 [Thalassotalea loyana]|uniref:Replication gene A protein-like domain-containing protein n=1 Tax=Thalassotalea loyana TaxID=280483 RepID=A0ABQ6HH55_9GAMM|nr:replication endonuclease [Thalassotalea loyana]GLX85851.1 hypothetical protein tloyanaT_21030 [Thalassotalea loyana]